MGTAGRYTIELFKPFGERTKAVEAMLDCDDRLDHARAFTGARSLKRLVKLIMLCDRAHVLASVRSAGHDPPLKTVD